MAKFPIREAEVKSLAQNIATGLVDNVATYPAPPVTAVALQAVLDSYITLGDEAVSARAASELATDTKVAGFDELTDAMRAVLRYAEDTVDYDDTLLSKLGWGGKASGTALEAPGQPRILEIVSQGEGWINLDWKRPDYGGKVASYKIERRERPSGEWGIVALAIESEVALTSQERGKDWEYRVIAVNKAGEGVPSNMVDAVL
jgi:hypothetical protein